MNLSGCNSCESLVGGLHTLVTGWCECRVARSGLGCFFQFLRLKLLAALYVHAKFVEDKSARLRDVLQNKKGIILQRSHAAPVRYDRFVRNKIRSPAGYVDSLGSNLVENCREL